MLAQAQPIRVLLVDDHPALRAGLRLILEAEAGIEIGGEAEDGLSAVRLAVSAAPHAVVMDVALPQMSGVDATKEIVAQAPSVNVLALSAHEDLLLVRQALDAGAKGFALKRSAPEEIVRAVRTVAAGESYLDPALRGALAVTGPRRNKSVGTAHVNLSQREAAVVRLVAEGRTHKEMAEILHISPRTLETYRARAMSKLSLSSRADVIRYALRCGWLRES